MRGWIDQTVRVGIGDCAVDLRGVFAPADGEVAFVRDGDRLLPSGVAGAARLGISVIEAADEYGCVHLGRR